VNKDPFIDLVREKTGIQVEVISGEEEARLTGLGIQYALDLWDRPFIAFDLGGGQQSSCSVDSRAIPKLCPCPWEP